MLEIDRFSGKSPSTNAVPSSGASESVQKKQRKERQLLKRRRKALRTAFKMIRSNRTGADKFVDIPPQSSPIRTSRMSEEMISDLPDETREIVKQTFKEVSRLCENSIFI